MRFRPDRREFLTAMTTLTASCTLPAIAERDVSIHEAASDSAIEFGTDYYAEDWPAERLETDAKLMREAKFRTVRLIDTNWERIEPKEGHYTFEWLDRVVEVLSRYRIRSILGTSSYVPPAWLATKHPDFYLVNEAGVRSRWGNEGFMCLNHPLYLQYVQKLVTALATHYGRNPAVIGWQIDNEMGVWGYACYDQVYCLPKFRKYLKDKFGTLDEFNRRLLTVSYGHTYSSWDEIPLPTRDDQSPLILEESRFFSSNITDFLGFQAEILRRATSGQFITHNGPHRIGNCFEYARQLDFLCADNYPKVGAYIEPAFYIDLVRGFNRGKSFQVLEHRSGTYGGQTLGDATPPPGMVRLWAWQTLAHGADGVLFFRWRMSNGGNEQYWQGILNHAGMPARVFPEIRRMGTELEKVGSEFVHSESPSRVAVVMSYDSYWALRIGGEKAPYPDQLKVFSSSFRRLGLNADIVEATDNLGRYKIVAAPALHVVSSGVAENLESFVNNGGILILTARSGFKNPDNLATDAAPGILEKMAQVWVGDFTSLEQSTPPEVFGFPTEVGAYRPNADNRIESVSADWPGQYQAKIWADILDPDGAKPLFRYSKDYYSGKAAVTAADYGQGKVIYVGTLLEPHFYLDLARRACNWAKLDLGSEIPEGMDFAVRQTKERSFTFLMNFSDQALAVRIPGTLPDLLSGRVFTDTVTVPAMDLCVLVREL